MYMMEKMTLREVCLKAGVSRRTVQGYEKAGLVTAAGKNKYGYLLYDEQGLEQIRHIRFLQDLGFSLKEIRIFTQGTETQQREMLLTRIAALERRGQELDALIKQARQLVKQLQ